MPKPNPDASKAAAVLGAKGGRYGTGKRKTRDAHFYSFVLPEARRRARERREKQAKKEAKP